MTKLRYCISSMGIAWLGSDFASSLEQHELYLRLAGKDSEWIFCSNQWQECQCNNHVRLLACMILYVDFIIANGLLDILLKRNSSAPVFQNPNAKVGNGEEMEVDQPQEGRCIVLSEASRTESFETILKTMRRCKKSVSCQLIAARKRKDLPDLLGKGTRICCPRCDVNSLGDPVPGEDGKHCQCLVSHGRLLTEFEATCDFYLVFQIVS